MEKVETSVFEKIAASGTGSCNGGRCSDCVISKEKTNKLCMVNMSAEIVRLRSEREKNPGVWDGAPEWADRCVLRWEGSENFEWKQYKEHTRTLPKTKAREIAERCYQDILNNRQTTEDRVCAIESAINEALGGEK